MSKKILIIIGILILIVIAGLSFGRLFKKGKVQLLDSQILAPSVTPVELATWEDQSEFEFKYPKNLNLNPHPEDEENYAHLELTGEGSKESIILWTKDTKYQTVDDYVKGAKITNYIGSQLGDLPAVKVLDESDSNNFSLLTIRDGYLYQIDVKNMDQEIYNIIVNSYRFTGDSEEELPATQNSAQPPPISEEIYTEEEVIE
mgnify:CR=1 FL=1